MKTYLIILATIFIGGAFIWSCSQNDMDGERSIYHYSADQLVKIQLLAEQYGVSDVKFPKESETRLPSMEEIEEIFRNFAVIKNMLSQPLEIIQQDENHIQFRTRRSLAHKRLTGDEGVYFTGSQDKSHFCEISVGQEKYTCWLNVLVSWENTNATDFDTRNKVSIKTEFEIAPTLDSSKYYVSNESSPWHWEGASTIVINYSATINSSNGFVYTYEEKIEVNVQSVG